MSKDYLTYSATPGLRFQIRTLPFQVLIIFGRSLARLHQQITQQPRAGFTDAAVSFAFRGRVFHGIEAHVSSHLAGGRETTEIAQGVDQTKRGQQTHARMCLQAAALEHHSWLALAATAPRSQCAVSVHPPDSVTHRVAAD